MVNHRQLHKRCWVVGLHLRYAIAMSFVGRPKDHMLPYIKSMEAAAKMANNADLLMVMQKSDSKHMTVPFHLEWIHWTGIWKWILILWTSGTCLPSFNKLVAKHGRKQTQWTPQKIKIAHMVAKIWLFGIVWYVLETITLWCKIWTAVLVFLLPTRDPLILFLSLFIASVSNKGKVV